MMRCPNCAHEFEPLVLDGAKPKGHTLQTFSQWVDSLNGEDAIRTTDAVYRYAESMKIPERFIELAWMWFQRKYGSTGSGARKKYKDWRAHFLTAVRENYARLWWLDDEGVFKLTVAGRQLDRELGE